MNVAMKPTLKSPLVEYMMEKPFFLVNDGTSDTAIRMLSSNSTICVQLPGNTAQKQAFYLTL